MRHPVHPTGTRAAPRRAPQFRSPLLAMLATGAVVLAGCAAGPAAAPGSAERTSVTGSSFTGTTLARTAPAYPHTATGTQVDTYHGEAVADPYRWLEDLDSLEVKEWIAAQNAVSRPWLEAIPARSRIAARMTQLWNFERWGASLRGGNSFVVPERRGGRYFWLKSDGLQDQPVLYVADALDAPPRVALDPNTFSADRTIALKDYEVSPDARHVAYAISDGGSDWATWRIRELAAGTDLDERIGLVKFSGVSWSTDARGFYYSRYPAGPGGRGDDSKQVGVWYHLLGTPQESDRFVYAVADHATRNPYAEVSDDGRFLVISVREGAATNGLYYLDLAQPAGEVVRLLDRWDARYEFVGNRGRTFYVRTTSEAPRGRIVAIDLDDARPSRWQTLVPQAADAIDAASFVGGRFVVTYLRDARSVVRAYTESGGPAGDVALPGLGQVVGFRGRTDSTEVFFAYTDFLTPRAIYRYDVAANAVTEFRRPAVALDPAQYVAEQVFYPSKDGTRVPMFVVRRRDLPRDGRRPTLLYGYGGFNSPMLPQFSVPVATWLEMGGVYAVANLRGGGEYGEAWHLAGTRTRKQNVFDDFAAAAQWLVANRWTSRERLAISGRSNGGLLVGAALTQRPELYGATLPAVGVLDMLRYHTASANARQWSSDYGLSEDAVEYRALRAYSPLHAVRESTCYPPTLITTADHDDRVVPWHSFKFAARLQAAQAATPGCANPILLRVETRAGHGAGKPTWMQIADYADQWAFLAQQLDMGDVLPGVVVPAAAGDAGNASAPTANAATAASSQ